jgi:hypothetical protein
MRVFLRPGITFAPFAVSLLFSCWLNPPVLAAPLSFTPPDSIPVGAWPVAVTAADWNADGIPDLAVSDNSANRVSLLLGNGDGSFRPRIDLMTDVAPHGVAAVDLDRDGHLDMVVVHGVTDSVSVLRGNGDGTFAPKIDYPCGYNAIDISAGDLNGDGWPDLALASFAAGGVIVLLNDGAGGLGPPVVYQAGINPVGAVITELNGDGKLDVATADGGYLNRDWSISTLMGKGDGSLQAPTTYGTGLWPISIAAGDLDGDGWVDLAESCEGSGHVALLLNNRDGTFRGSGTTVGTDCGLMAIADLDQDGHLDLVVPERGGPNNTVAVSLGRGDGSFLPSVSWPAGVAPYSCAVADFNLDGWPDIVVTNPSTNSISVLFNATGIVSVDAGRATRGLEFFPPAPNPARDRLSIRYRLPSAGPVDLLVYDTAGRWVATLLHEVRPPGEGSFNWDLRDHRGPSIRAGVYFMVLQSSGMVRSQPVVVLH